MGWHSAHTTHEVTYARRDFVTENLCKEMHGLEITFFCPWLLFYLLIYHRKSSCELKVCLKRRYEQRACLLELLSPRSIAAPQLLLTLHKEVGQVHPTVTTAFTLWPSANKRTGCLSALLDALPCKDWPLWPITEYNFTPLGLPNTLRPVSDGSVALKESKPAESGWSFILRVKC